jgi:oxygen-independent coproporphyrinogen-3 oxidase
MAPHNLYIHIPFCASKCNYCAFHSSAVSNPDWDGLADAIIGSAGYWAARLSRCRVPTVFFGGGTPSLLPAAIFARIMNAVRAAFDVAPDAEISIEANPGTLDAAKLREFAAAGMTRLSVGVQSLDARALSFLGRRHSARDAIGLLDSARALGLRVSGDFIYGLPGQTLRDVMDMCRGILELGLSHASVYELCIEPGTPLAARGVAPVGNDAAADMYMAVNQSLAPALQRYEVSNYAALGDECRHNADIWAGGAYIGVGPSACGRVLLDDGRWLETREFAGEITERALAPRTRALEKIITGMRTMRGVGLSPDVRDAIDWKFVKENPDLIAEKDGFLAAAGDGIMIMDWVVERMVSGGGAEIK